MGTCREQLGSKPSVVNPGGPRKMTSNEERLFCGAVGRLALHGDGFPCLGNSAGTWSALSLLNSVLVFSCCRFQYSPPCCSEHIHFSSLFVVTCFLSSPAPSWIDAQLHNSRFQVTGRVLHACAVRRGNRQQEICVAKQVVAQSVLMLCPGRALNLRHWHEPRENRGASARNAPNEGRGNHFR